ncbi:zinc ABC transporter substrate-binding protein AztC [Buchananella felis]|uniref:zinc ABC transporter substrate-binding protein AztC n=1 Tax=Buchananella felis TaxID=3231492 RepID=UPI003526DE31
MSRRLRLAAAAVGVAALAALGGCSATSDDGRASVVVTTNVLGDVVTNLVGDQAEVTVLMPPNADPHSFGVSAQDALKMQKADLLVYNGLGLEEGLLSHVRSAADAGTPTFVAGDHVELLEYAGGEASGPDPHFWTDPTQMVAVVEALTEDLAKIEGIDAAKLRDDAAAYTALLEEADARARAAFEAIPAQQRALVTNHHVFGYLARRYDFRVIGAVIPGGATLAAPSAADLADLADAVKEAGVGAIFADVSSPDKLINTLAEHTGMDIEVVPLFTESLSEPGGEAPTYLEMLRVNTERIARALG